MRITRRFTRPAASPYANIAFRTTDVVMKNPDGRVVYAFSGVEVPERWSQVAADILVQKYFRKSGVPLHLRKFEEETVPSWLWRSLPVGVETAGESSAKQVFDRLSGTWAYWGWKGGYFDSEEDARSYHDEMCFMLAMQMGAPNSPQWFNTGLYWAYGIEGPAQGHFY